MRSRASFALFALMAGSTSVVLVARSLGERTVRREIEDQCAKAVQAYKDKDPRAYASMFTADATIDGPDGRTFRGRQAIEEFARSHMATIVAVHSAHMTIDELTITNRGQQAVATITQRWEAATIDTKGRYGPKGRTVEAVWTQPNRVAFARTSQGWLVKSVHRTSDGAFTVADARHPAPIGHRPGS